jgi:16S rRNA (guanine527-N7)-methyltransferase
MTHTEKQLGDLLGSDSALIKAFTHLLALLNKWNKAYNLTAITDPDEQISKHIADSLSILDDLQGHTILDVGTGPGFPGLPLAIACPDKQFTLLDSNSKKTRFIQQAINELKLQNVQLVHARVEQFQTDPGFDCIVSRAFSRITLFLEASRHLIAPHGRWLAMKGEYPQNELNEIPQDFLIEYVRKLDVPGLGATRHLISIKKGIS